MSLILVGIIGTIIGLWIISSGLKYEIHKAKDEILEQLKEISPQKDGNNE